MKNAPMISRILFGSMISIMINNSSFAATDTEPLVLREIMQNLGKNMQVIADSIAREDWQQVEQAANDVANHPKPPLFEKTRILTFIGRDIGKFKNFDIKTHDLAQELSQLAKNKDGKAIIKSFSDLQNSCLNCHQIFRQDFIKHFYPQK